MAANPISANDVHDKDVQETREWTDALSAVIESEGPERAHFLLEQLLEHARQKSIDMPFSATTGYVNTIEPEQQEHAPGNLEIEERLRATCAGTRWRWLSRPTACTRLMVVTWAGILVLSPHWPACLVQALTTFGMRKVQRLVKSMAATASTFKATCHPASMRVPILRVV